MDPKINLIIRSNTNEERNLEEKDRFNKVIRETALGLFRNYQKHTKVVSQKTEEFLVNISKNMDGKTFTLFIKYLNDLRADVLENDKHKLSPDSFLIYLDKVRNLTHSQQLNDLILRKMQNINIDELKTKRMLNTYQQHSIDFKFEENLRMGEIKQFANEVIPKPRFIFDKYKISPSEEEGTQTNQDNKEENESQQNQQQHHEQEEYFSFFSSHEKVILKPESNFKNLRQFLTFLPIDYYILLQDQYETKSAFSKTNYVMFHNLPLLQKKKTYFDTTVVKEMLYEDIYRCIDQDEADLILNDPYAFDQLKSHLSSNYGKIDDMFIVNFKISEIIAKYISRSKDIVKLDQLAEFSSIIDQDKGNQFNEDANSDQVEASFQELMNLTKEEFFEAEERAKKGNQETIPIDEKNQSQVLIDLKKREMQKLGLNRPILRSGFLKFKAYNEKIKMMDTPLFLFGMKIHRHQFNVEFFDADFANTLLIESQTFTDKTLGECCKIINDQLVRSGFQGDLMKVGQLKDINDFNLKTIKVREGFRITLRFNDFPQALRAFQRLSRVQDYKKMIEFRCYFQNPAPNYYDGKLATLFENCIKDKFEGLNQINEVESNYIKRSILELKEQAKASTQSI